MNNISEVCGDNGKSVILVRFLQKYTSKKTKPIKDY